ncbi:hypothetical protein RIF29_09750 [Crotalaria pallida]|uniref:Uncharacterized protein n=1 Tax=Crotalaria pallida TaxID=3830 RepID=A0AAN9FYD9_CROPI
MDDIMFGDPQLSALALLAEEATRERSIPLHIKKITFRVGARKPMKSDAAADDEALKSYDLAKAETNGWNKPIDLCSKKPIKVMDSSSKGSTSINLCLSPKKMSNFNANDVLKEEAPMEEPATFMNSAIIGAEPANFQEDDHVMRMKKGKDLKRMRETLMDDAVDGEWVPGEFSSSKTKKKQKKSAHPQAIEVEVEVEAEPSVLPQKFMDRINEMGGTEITLVFSKVLYTTDLTKQAS